MVQYSLSNAAARSGPKSSITPTSPPSASQPQNATPLAISASSAAAGM
jgi:hypothetical protein